MILCLETATTVCSVALCDSGGVVALKESHETRSHAALLTVYIEELLDKKKIKANQLEAIAVSKGPGSYTGLRIGVSVAKGIAYAASLPLIGVDTTRSMFYGIIGEAANKYGADDHTLFCPMLDAKRMEVYYSLYNIKGETVREICASVIEEDSFSEIPESTRIIFFGDGSDKFRSVIKRANSVFADTFRMSAAHMFKPALEAFTKGRFEDLAYFEPFYLKDFIATIPRKNIIGS